MASAIAIIYAACLSAEAEPQTELVDLVIGAVQAGPADPNRDSTLADILCSVQTLTDERKRQGALYRIKLAAIASSAKSLSPDLRHELMTSLEAMQKVASQNALNATTETIRIITAAIGTTDTESDQQKEISTQAGHDDVCHAGAPATSEIANLAARPANTFCTANLEPQDRDDLQKAKLFLCNPGIVERATALLEGHIQDGLNSLPPEWSSKIGGITQTAIMKAADAAIFTMKDAPKTKASNWLHKIGVATTGAIGGALGLPALAIELPISTTLMLRSTLDIARSEGESISTNETKLACLEVFAFGTSKNIEGDEATDDYFLVRTLLAAAVTEASQALARNAGSALTKESSSAILRLITIISERFSINVTEKAAAQLVPLIGAVGGATINTLFMDHYQDVARGHFTIRRLERKYGKDAIKSAYLALPAKQDPAPASRRGLDLNRLLQRPVNQVDVESKV